MKKVTLTQLEETVLTYIADTLSGNFGEGYSDVDHAEIAKKLEKVKQAEQLSTSKDRRTAALKSTQLKSKK